MAAVAARLGAARLEGRYLPTEKNAMVADHYEKLGFRRLAEDAQNPGAAFGLAIADYRAPDLPMAMIRD